MSELFGLKPTAKPVAVSSSMVTKPNGEKPKEGTEIENKKGKESRKRKISNTETFADMLKTMSAKSINQSNLTKILAMLLFIVL
jgi:hypothetical protein